MTPQTAARRAPLKGYRMVGKGPDMPRYEEYVAYVEAGELQGTMSYEEWMGRQATQPPLGAIAVTKVVPRAANVLTGAVALAEAIRDLRDRAKAEKATGSDALAAYMLGRASQWPKAWLRRQVADDAREFAEVGYDFDGAGR